MPSRHFLYDFAGPVVADTSVVINLNAPVCSEALLAALPNQVLQGPHARSAERRRMGTGSDRPQTGRVVQFPQEDPACHQVH